MTSTEYLLPEMPFGGPEITIVRWLRSLGDRVTAGEPLLVVVNDRVELALPAPGDGVLERTLAAVGATVTAGAPVAVIGSPAATDTTDLPQPAQPGLVEEQGALPERSLRISPVARRIASSAGIDIAKLAGSGISGRIVKADLLTALANTESTLGSIPSLQPPASSLQSLADDIYVLTAIEVDMQRVVEAVGRLQPGYARRRQELRPGACVALAAVAALACHPLLNSAWQGDIIVAPRRVHLAIASGTGAPVRLVHNAQDLNLRGLARAFGSRPSHAANDDRESTFTIVELSQQAWGDPSALARGRSAALGVGAVRLRPLALGDGRATRLAMRHTALMTLAYDPRVLDQGRADAFLRELKRRLEQFDP
jgi:2-oxoglutarate dehydrogenase E2 component (dihydrolipoamide succinyltransferase)